MTQETSPAKSPESLGSFCVSGLVVDISRREAKGPGGLRLDLKPRSFKVLHYLALNAGRVVPKDELLQVCWPDVFVTEDSLTQSVSEIRKCLGETHRDLIKTVPREGYVLVRINVPDVEEVTASVVSKADAPAAATQSPAARSVTMARYWQWFVPGATALFALIGVLVVSLTASEYFTKRPEKASGPPVLVVMPFQNMSGDQNLQYFVDGTTRNLSMMVSRTPYLKVVSASPEGPISPDDIRAEAKEAGAQYALTGSVQLSGDNMRIIAELREIATGVHIWAERFDRTSSDPFGIQDEIAQAAINALVGEGGEIIRMEHAAAWGRDPTVLGEYDVYLRGHAHFILMTDEGTRRAIEIWKDGLKSFPKSGLLKVKLAWGHDQLYYSGFSKIGEEELRIALAYATDAFRDEDALSPLAKAIGHWVLCSIYGDLGQVEKAAPECRKTIELMPYDRYVRHGLAWFPLAEGKLDEAAQMLLDLSPKSPNAVLGYGYYTWLLFARKDYEGCVEAADASPEPTLMFTVPFKAACLAALGRIDEARLVVKGLTQDNRSASVSFFRSYHDSAIAEIVERECEMLRMAGLREEAI